MIFLLLQIQEESTRSHRLAVTSLEKDVRALQQKCADSNDRANNLKNELEKLKTTKTSNQHKATQTSLWEPVQHHESREVQENERESGNDKSDVSNKDILDVAASRIKQLAMSDSEEDSLSGKLTSWLTPSILQVQNVRISSTLCRHAKHTKSSSHVELQQVRLSFPKNKRERRENIHCRAIKTHMIISHLPN